jgi:SRSO17 transposase
MERHFEDRKRAVLAECRVDEASLACIADRLAAFVEPFAKSLVTEEQRQAARCYVTGLASDLERKNAESIAYLHQQDRQRLQRFIGYLNWDHRPLLNELADQVAAELGEPDGVLVVDPSAFSKKGVQSVGVQRQWNGREGKIDNCQLGIYLAYVSRKGAALTNLRLYLPKSWTENKTKRDSCNVPAEIEFATRLDLARELLDEQRSRLPHSWITGDDEFGRSTQFRREMRERGEKYLLAVPSTQLICEMPFTTDAELEFESPPVKSFERISGWASRLREAEWTRVDIRDGAKGPVVAFLAVARVLAKRERKKTMAVETLVAMRRQDENGGLIFDYFLSNAPLDTSPAELARVANCRQRIEDCFQKAKGEAGLADYEVRTWAGWHHHQTLSLLAAWFLTRETRSEKKTDSGDDTATGANRHCASPASSLGRRHIGPHPPRMRSTAAAKRTRPSLSPQTAQLLGTTAD